MKKFRVSEFRGDDLGWLTKKNDVDAEVALAEVGAVDREQGLLTVTRIDARTELLRHTHARARARVQASRRLR
jgi:hypothetical protein